MRRLAVAVAVTVAASSVLSGCSLTPRHQIDAPIADAALRAKVCANGDGAVQAVEIGGISTRWVANVIVDNTTSTQPIHSIAVAAAADPNDTANRDHLAAWIRQVCDN